MSIVVRHSLRHMPAIGSAGLATKDLREGYCATFCFVAEDGGFVDVHVTPDQLRHLTKLLADQGASFTQDERFLAQQRRKPGGA
jgi:hypothetical protein